jgi:hypothetical protein
LNVADDHDIPCSDTFGKHIRFAEKSTVNRKATIALFGSPPD